MVCGGLRLGTRDWRKRLDAGERHREIHRRVEESACQSLSGWAKEDLRMAELAKASRLLFGVERGMEAQWTRLDGWETSFAAQKQAGMQLGRRDAQERGRETPCDRVKHLLVPVAGRTLLVLGANDLKRDPSPQEEGGREVKEVPRSLPEIPLTVIFLFEPLFGQLAAQEGVEVAVEQPWEERGEERDAAAEQAERQPSKRAPFPEEVFVEGATLLRGEGQQCVPVMLRGSLPLQASRLDECKPVFLREIFL